MEIKQTEKADRRLENGMHGLYDYNLNNVRLQRGKAIFQRKNQIHLIDEYFYKVKSQSIDTDYDVMFTSKGWICACSDHMFRKVICKHIYAAGCSLQVYDNGSGIGIDPSLGVAE